MNRGGKGVEGGRRGMIWSTSISTEGLRKHTVTLSYENPSLLPELSRIRTDAVEYWPADVADGDLCSLFVCLFLCNVYSSISVVNDTVLIYVNGVI